jgi:hypothetical protein
LRANAARTAANQNKKQTRSNPVHRPLQVAVHYYRIVTEWPLVRWYYHEGSVTKEELNAGMLNNSGNALLPAAIRIFFSRLS